MFGIACLVRSCRSSMGRMPKGCIDGPPENTALAMQGHLYSQTGWPFRPGSVRLAKEGHQSAIPQIRL